MLYAIAATLALVAPLQSDGPVPRTLEPASMEEDLLLLLDTLITQHGGLYRYCTEGELDEAFGELLFDASETMSVLDFHRAVAAFLGKIGCGHTRAIFPGPDRTAVLDRSGALPFEVHLSGDRAWVVRTLGKKVGLEPGDEILSIDGLSIATVRERATGRLTSDGFNETLKERVLERRFGELFVLLAADLDGLRADHEVVVAGMDEAVLVPGLSAYEYDAALGARNPGPRIELHDLGDRTARLIVRAFGDPAEGTFPDGLAAAFEEVRATGVESLILDLRGNGGGDDLYGALLVSYFSPEPFGYFDRIEVTADYVGPGDVVDRDGSRFVTAHPGLRVQEPSSPGFGGALFVLIDGWTFSTAADVATVLHHNGLGTFLGEESGGGYDGNTSGSSEMLVLPNSLLRVNVPHWMYTTANVGHGHPGRGVPVDHAVRASIEDVLAGRDAVLERALELAHAR